MLFGTLVNTNFYRKTKAVEARSLIREIYDYFDHFSENHYVDNREHYNKFNHWKY